MSQEKKYGDGDTSFQAAGGMNGIRQWVEDFYHIMSELPQAQSILAMHPKDLDESKDKLALFLSGWLGGPSVYKEKYGPISIPSAHAHLSLGVEHRESWLTCMRLALDRQSYTEPFKAYLMAQLFVPADRCIKH